MKKILIIPHHPGLPKLKIRLIEIAKRLSQEYTVYLVNWRAVQGRYSLPARVSSALRDIFSKVKFYKKATVNIVDFPILHRPLYLVPKFNSFWLKKFIEREKIDIVINGSYYMFNIPEKRRFKYIIDFADLPVTRESSYFDRFVQAIVKEEIKKADAVTVVSKCLVDYVYANYGYRSFLLPNGTDIQKLREVDKEKIKKIQQEHGLLDKWVIGYIGYIGEWVDVELAVGAFNKIKKEIPQAVLMWVGPSPNMRELKRRYSKEGVIFTEGVTTDEIEPYFQMLNIGILPHEKSLFQDLAFHIKLIEYTVARKIVVSTPLEEVKRLNFPNVLLADLNIGDWAEAIKKAKSMKWSDEWDRVVEQYDWNIIFNELCNIIE